MGGDEGYFFERDVTKEKKRSEEIIAVDEALTALAGTDERKARIVELRFFVGLSIEETAALLEVSPGTVMKDWTFAKAWLQRKLNKINSDER
jgi:RNA polymerase sigma factor (sigma-70 family)